MTSASSDPVPSESEAPQAHPEVDPTLFSSPLHRERVKAERLRIKRRKQIFQGTFSRAVLGHLPHPLHASSLPILAKMQTEAKANKKKLKLEIVYPIARKKARNVLKRKRHGRI